MPIEVGGHKDPKTKVDRGLNSRESSHVLVTLGELLSVGSHLIASQRNHIPIFKYTGWVCIASGFVLNWQTFEDFGSKV